MADPYKKRLQELKGQEKVTIHRADAPGITGKLEVVDEDGCFIDTPEGADGIRSTFVAHRDIRGVSTVGWDPEIIGG